MLALACSPPSVDERPGSDDPAASEPEAQRRSGDPRFVDLGTIASGEDIAFAVPRGALGFNIVVEASAINRLDFGVERITDPMGNVVHDQFTPKGGVHPTSVSLGRMAAVSVPQGDGATPPREGKWTFRVGVPALPSKKLELRAKVRIQASGDGDFHGGTLDLHIHVPRATIEGATLTRGECEERIAGFYEALNGLVGIGRGKVTYYEVDASLATVATVEEGFSLPYSSPPEKGLQVLLTREFMRNVNDEVHGASPGIPGAANTFGTTLSGIFVVATDSVERDVETMLHEAGHFFGLNHTTELSSRGDVDPLSDTPQCVAAAGTSQPDYRKCDDRANLMFGVGPVSGPLVLTEMQKRVVRGSPIYDAKIQR